MALPQRKHCTRARRRRVEGRFLSRSDTPRACFTRTLLRLLFLWHSFKAADAQLKVIKEGRGQLWPPNARKRLPLLLRGREKLLKEPLVPADLFISLAQGAGEALWAGGLGEGGGWGGWGGRSIKRINGGAEVSSTLDTTEERIGG